MRILFLTQWFQPEPFFKGLPLVKAIEKKGHHVEVLTGFPNYPGGKIYDGYKIRFYRKERMDGIVVHRIPLYPSHNSSSLCRIINYLSFAIAAFCIGPWLIKKPDVIYVYNLVSLMPSAWFIRVLFRTKILLDVQDLWPESVKTSGMLKSPIFLKIIKNISNWAYQTSDFLIVQSEGFKLALAQRGVKKNKIKVIMNWANENQKIVLQKNYARNSEIKTIVLFAGTLGLVQKLDVILETAHLCQKEKSNIVFKIVGNGPDKQRLMAKARDLQLKNVKFFAFRDPEKMSPIYNQADLMLVHLKKDRIFEITIPSKTQAYLFAGKPILMALKGDAKKLILKAKAGLCCPPENAKLMMKSIQKFQSMSQSKRHNMGFEGRRFYFKKLSFSKGVAKIENSMLKLVS